ncbi:MAG: C25 family cysteine peptidase [bacterium]
MGISEDEITTPDKIESDNILTPIQIPYLNKPIIESSAVEVLPPEFSEPSVIKVDVIREDLSGIIFDIEFPEPEFSLVEKNNRVFTKVDLPTNNVLKKPGKPNLPYQVVIVSIPFNSDVLVSSSVENEKTFSDILPYPTPKLVLNYDSMGIPYPEYVYLYDESIYNGKNFYPQILTEIETKGSVRGYPVVRIAIYPLQYNPQNNSLSFYQKIRIKIDFIGGEVKRDIIEKDSLSQSEEEFLRAFSDTVVNKNTFRYFRHKEETNSFDNFTAYDLYQLGDVYKIFIKDPGVYKVSSDWLADRGINLIGTESKSIKLYTGDHIDLIEELPSTEEPNDGISEVPLIFYDGGDGRFDRGDYFVFYGFGASFIDDNWHINSKKFHKCKYTEYSVYFLTSNTDGDGSRYTDVDLSPQGGEEKIDFYNYREHHEYETIGAGQGQYKNPPEGDNWYWTSINAGLTWEYIFQLKNIDFSRNMVLGFRFQGKATREYETVYHHVRIYINYIDYEHLIYENDNWKDNEWIEAEVDVSGGILRDGDNIIYIQNVSDKSKFSDFWVDWLDFLYWRKSKPEDNKIEFGTYNITEGKKLFEVGPFNSSDLVAFNRIHNNKIAGKIENRSDGYYFIFADEIKTELKIYDVYQLDEFGEPVDVVKDQPTELHSKANGADGIYITYDYYYDIIKPLADLHRKDGYDVMVIKAEDVYEEFGKGQFDPTAMRNLIFYAYNNWAKEPLYITLVGSCTKDPMDHWHRQKDNARIYLHHGMNTMPVHNEFMGGEEYYGWVPADVWFVCIDYGDPEALMPDLAISRISAYDKEYTAWVVEKTIKYISKPKYGDWRTSITLCADNGLLGEEGNFSEDSEKLIRDILPYGFLYKKLYLESLNFPEEWLDPEHKGQRQSWTRLYLTPKLYTNFGSLFTQFSGHGSYNIWCHEYLFIDWRVHPHNPFQEWQKTITVEPFGSFIPSDVLKLQNYDEYPFVMMMSCNLGHIDLEVEVMTEKLTFIKNKGALMAEGEARLGYENTQDKFNRGVMSRIFPNKKVPDERMAFSIPFWLAKLDADMSTRIQRNLIGDCMVKVGFPTKKIEVASDKSLYKRGEVIKIDGTIIDDSEFNGYAIVKITDNILYCKIDSTSFPYSYRDRVLTKTKVKVEGGRFSANIPIPYDTGDGEEPTKVAFNVYAYDENRNIEAVLNENKRVDIEGWGGSSDSQGPQISIRAGNEDFIDGDFVPKKCPLWIDLQDESGILLADSDDIKEPISVEVTGVKGTIDVTYLFTSEVDDYCKGSIFLYVDIPDGERQIKVTAYDIYNNKTTAVVNVRTEKGLTLKDVMNCPNPVKSDTYFTFSASKMVDEVKIMIFTVSGRHIKTIEKIHLLPGYNEIYWDCLDDNGRSIANGVYLYKITARTDNEKCEVYEKLIMMR